MWNKIMTWMLEPFRNARTLDYLSALTIACSCLEEVNQELGLAVTPEHGDGFLCAQRDGPVLSPLK